MCIIGYAPKNHTISDEKVRTMFENNPDGAGIMWKPADGGPVEIRKGFFNIDSLLSAWHKVPMNAEKALHCRIATHGRVNAQCCHPFPVRETTLSMKNRKDNTDCAVMHNGIISLTSPPKGINSPFSDSMMFAKEVLYSLKGALSNEYIQEMVEDAIGYSRLLIFRQNGDTVRLGTWVKDGKCFFSNDTYKAYKYYSTYTVSSTPTAKAVADAKDAVKGVLEKKSSTSPSSNYEYDFEVCDSCTARSCEGCDVYKNYCTGYGAYDDFGDESIYDDDGSFILDDETRTMADQLADAITSDEVKEEPKEAPKKKSKKGGDK